MTAMASLQVIVMSNGTPPCKELALWLSDNCPGWKYGSEDYGIDNARNQNCERFLADDVGKSHLMMIDHDMVPVTSTSAIFTATEELVYCGYADRYGSKGHYGDGDFGAACFKVSRDLLITMGMPWFATRSIHSHRQNCECNFFRVKAATFGIIPRMVGVVGHQQRCILLPDPKPPGWRIAWPGDIKRI